MADSYYSDYHNNIYEVMAKIVNSDSLQYLIQKIKSALSGLESRISSPYTFKGSCTFEELPTMRQEVGDFYNITNNFTLDGTSYPAGSNVCWDGTSWQVIASASIKDIKVNGSSVVDENGNAHITIPSTTEIQSSLASEVSRAQAKEAELQEAVEEVEEKARLVVGKRTQNLFDAQQSKIGDFYYKSGKEFTSNIQARTFAFQHSVVAGKYYYAYSACSPHDETDDFRFQLAAASAIPTVGGHYDYAFSGSISDTYVRAGGLASGNASYLVLTLYVQAGVPGQGVDTAKVDRVVKSVLDTLIIVESDTAMSYPIGYVPYEVISVTETNLSDSINEKLNSIPESAEDLGAVPLNQGSVHAGLYLKVGADGLVTLGEGSGGGGSLPSDAVARKDSASFHIGESILTEASVQLGNGWSGTLAGGFAHSGSSTESLTFNVNTISGKPYLVLINATGVTEGSLYVKIGNNPVVDTYNGSSSIAIGFIADGGTLSVIPATSKLINISSIRLCEVTESGEEIALALYNVTAGQTLDNLTGFWNVAISSDALASNQNGSRNVAIGRMAMKALISGTRNVAVGSFSMPFITEGDRNIAIGSDTIYSTSSTGRKKATDNVAIGKGTLKAGSDIKNNVAIGSGAMGSSTNTSNGNVAVGIQAGNYASTYNTHIGYRAGYYTKGNQNVSLGASAYSDSNNSGSGNICIGYNAGTKDPASSSSNPVTIDDSIAIGRNVKATKSKQTVIGVADSEIVLGGRKLIFNQDGTVSWETL